MHERLILVPLPILQMNIALGGRGLGTDLS